MNGIAEITNQTANLPIPSGWIYESAPGAFFWCGFGIVFGAGLLCLVVRAIKRRLAGGNDYE